MYNKFFFGIAKIFKIFDVNRRRDAADGESPG